MCTCKQPHSPDACRVLGHLRHSRLHQLGIQTRRHPSRRSRCIGEQLALLRARGRPGGLTRKGRWALALLLCSEWLHTAAGRSIVSLLCSVTCLVRCSCLYVQGRLGCHGLEAVIGEGICGLICFQEPGRAFGQAGDGLRAAQGEQGSGQWQHIIGPPGSRSAARSVKRPRVHRPR